MKTQLRRIISIGLLFASLVGSSGAWAVDCPQNSYTLTTQAQVDAFPQDCDSVAGDIQVGSSYLEPRSDITDLVGLANLTSVGGDLYISFNGALTNLDGLANLTSVGGDLYIGGGFNGNPALTNIDGLANLTSVGGDLYIFGNAALTNLDGLANLTSVGGDLYIFGNAALTNLDGLAKLTSVGGDLDIGDNAALTNCQGLAPVLGWPSGPPDDSVGRGISIEANGGTACESVEAVLASVSGPSQPVINTATGGNGNISLAFSPSTTADVLFPISGYGAVCSGLTEIETAQGVGSPLSVGNLTNYREYDCTVAPVTGLGALPLSNSVSATPMPVTEAPSAPQITDIVPGNAQVSINVSVADDGGSPITSTTAYCFGDKFVLGSTSHLLGGGTIFQAFVSGLTNGEVYECFVTATNSIGTSLASEVSAPFTPAAPPQPPLITNIEPGNGQVSISVSVPDDGGSPITGYTAYCLGDTAAIGTGQASPITVSGLTNGQAYVCATTATNDTGASQPSAVSGPVTPVAPAPGC
jgi:hypothetical protein